MLRTFYICRILHCVLCLGLLNPFTLSNSLNAQEDAPYIDLLTEEGAFQWHSVSQRGQFEIVGDELRLSASRECYLTTTREFDDFTFEGQVLLPEGRANSGFLFRCHQAGSELTGYQAEVDGWNRRWSGALFEHRGRGWLWPSHTGGTKDPNLLKYESESKAFFRLRQVATALRRDRWNSYRITCQGASIRIEVNGVVTTDIDDTAHSSGVIGLQHHGETGAVYRFRNLRVRPGVPPVTSSPEE